jgi:hypothetical protein
MSTSTISLCIPRVFTNITENQIRSIFEELSLGVIRKIDIVSITSQKGDNFNRVFIHFDKWFDNANANQTIERLQSGKDIKIMYEDPWFWKISLYRKKEETNNNNNNNTPRQNKSWIDLNNITPPVPACPKKPAQSRMPNLVVSSLIPKRLEFDEAL